MPAKKRGRITLPEIPTAIARSRDSLVAVSETRPSLGDPKTMCPECGAALDRDAATGLVACACQSAVIEGN